MKKIIFLVLVSNIYAGGLKGDKSFSQRTFGDFDKQDVMHQKQERLFLGLLGSLFFGKLQVDFEKLAQDVLEATKLTIEENPELIPNIIKEIDIESHSSAIGLASQKNFEEFQTMMESQMKLLQEQMNVIQAQIESITQE